MTMRAVHKGLGVKFGGSCAVCGRHTGSRDWELAATSLYKREDGKFVVVHPRCVGGATKSRVGGGIVYRDEPEQEIQIETEGER